MIIELNFPSQFTFGAYSCTLTPNANAVDSSLCTISNNKLSITTGGNYALYSTTGKKTKKTLKIL